MTIKLHECKHKHHHKHHHDDGIGRINFQHDKVKSCDSVEVLPALRVVSARQPEEFVNNTNCSDFGNRDVELAGSLATRLGHDDKPGTRVASFLRGDNPKNASAQASTEIRHPHQFYKSQQNHLHNQQISSSRSRSCSHPSSFNFKFYRYQFLRVIVVLYITLVVVVANGKAMISYFYYFP